ncbi:CHAT domain-containing protein [Knoellia sp. S7-12]|uniref:CHAT domain-containing protein n=1 Tax=Knoellia sp. S7-12 TaxID=3126698 RepID=UPI00336951B9
MSRFGIAGPEAGLALLDEVHQMVEGSAAPLLGTIAHIQAGAINVMSSNWIEALTALAQVEPHLSELAPPERCATLINRGLAHLSLQHLDLGRVDLEAALDLAIAHDLPMEEFKARHNLGCVAFIAGDLPMALRLMAEAAAMDCGVGLARAHLDHAKVLLDAGLVDEAEQVLSLGLDAARHDRQPLERGDIQVDLARAALLRGDLASARSWAGRATRTFRALRATSRADEVELLGAAIDIGMGRHLTRAAKTAARWSTPTPVQPNERLGARIRAEVALARHDLANARREVSSLDGDASVSLSVFLHERLLAARIATEDGDHDRSKALLSGAAQRLARDQGSVHSHEVRAGLALHAARIRDADVAMATDSGSLDELFDATERWRAASLRAAPIRPPDDPEVAALVGQLRQLRRRSGLSGPTTDKAQETAAEVNQLQTEITERLRRTGGPSADADLTAMTLAATHTLVSQRHVTVVTFHEVRGTVVRLVVGSQIHQSVIGPTADVAAAASRAVADARAMALARPSMAAFLAGARESSVHRVDEMLLGGLDLASGTVVIVPTVGLASIPWRALPALRNSPVIAAPSVTAWARRGVTAGRSPDVVALAGPGLPRAQGEVSAVEKAWGRHTKSPSATTTTGYAVSADVRSALTSASVVHLAAHGHHVDQSPLFSSLDMGDGPVFAHELTSPLAAELVILSACDVGRSRGRTGDEPLGLAAALLSLGVQCVVAATNPIHDDVAAAAMCELHERLVAGTDVATALREVAANVAGAEAFCAYGNTWAVR